MEGMATRLCIYFEFADTNDYEVPDATVEFVEDVFEKYDLHVGWSGEYNILSQYFPDSDDNMAQIDEIETEFKDRFSEEKIDRNTVSRERYGVPPGAYQTWITIHNHPNDAKAEAKLPADEDKAQKRQEATEVGVQQCPECNSTDFLTIKEGGETVCTECGLIVD